MLPKPIEHTFVIDGEQYTLVEWTRGQEKRIRAEYALSIASAPGVIETIDGADLYTEAVARECLKEAPDIFWTPTVPTSGQNGTTKRAITFEHIPRALWEEFRKGVDAFLRQLFPEPPATPEILDAPGPAGPGELAAVETVPPLLRGRAE